MGSRFSLPLHIQLFFFPTACLPEVEVIFHRLFGHLLLRVLSEWLFLISHCPLLGFNVSASPAVVGLIPMTNPIFHITHPFHSCSLGWTLTCTLLFPSSLCPKPAHRFKTLFRHQVLRNPFLNGIAVSLKLNMFFHNLLKLCYLLLYSSKYYISWLPVNISSFKMIYKFLFFRGCVCVTIF